VGEQIADFTSYALAKMVLAAPNDASAAAAAEQMVRCAFSFQFFGADAGANEGVFPFHIGGPPNFGDNGIEFALEDLGPLLLDYGARFSPTLASYLAPRIQAAADVIVQKHNVCSAYTNICLTQTFELMALGRWFSQSTDATLQAYGQTLLQASASKMSTWTSFTTQNGLFEFDSPTYYNLDLQALGLGRRYAPDASSAATFALPLAYLWADIAANTFFPRGSLGGPHSRSYDFISGQGAVEAPMYLAGLRNTPGGGGVTEARNLLVFTGPSAYSVPAASLCAASAPTREVRSTWIKTSTDLGHERYAYYTPDYAIGSTSADYGNDTNDQDMLLTAELASGPASAIISVLPDYLDAPATAVGEGDFTKVTHLPLAPAAAQKGGAMLSLLRIPAKDPGYVDKNMMPIPVVNLSTNVIFPAQADELLLNGMPANLTADTPVASLPTVTARVGTGAVAVAVIAASGLECPDATGTIVDLAPPQIHFKPYQPTTGTSNPPPVMRLAIYHATTLPADTSTCFARVTLLWVADHCAGSGCAAALSSVVAKAAAGASTMWDPKTQAWSAEVSAASSAGPGPTLLVSRTVSPASLTRKVDGQDMTFAPLSVNGVSVGVP
jgi:hypothetical protein